MRLVQLQRHTIQITPHMIRHRAAPTALRCLLREPLRIIRGESAVTIHEINADHRLVEVIEHRARVADLFFKEQRREQVRHAGAFVRGVAFAIDAQIHLRVRLLLLLAHDHELHPMADLRDAADLVAVVQAQAQRPDGLLAEAEMIRVKHEAPHAEVGLHRLVHVWQRDARLLRHHLAKLTRREPSHAEPA